MIKWPLLASALLLSNMAFADVRVLVRFDSTGHYAHRIFDMGSSSKLGTDQKSPSGSLLKSAPVFSASPIARGRSVNQASSSPVAAKGRVGINGFIRLIWKSADGVQLAQTLLPDPRIVHSPAHVQGVQASRAGLKSGAWLATGPSTASSVEIYMPESASLGLTQEFWTLSLNLN